ncbi:MarR family winged helix-turn-helix transcriptional regulator [Kaistia defluvii]|uniref:MarR family transcriptional regulator for hemolysin n=1 Tax=Kaistia defluvii TaxID=410841 RepID=A0ABV2QY42_9HYPH
MVSYENRPKTFLGRLSQASRAMRTCFDSELKTLDLTLSRGRLMLHLVSASHVVTQSELTDALEVEHPTIVRLLDGLEQSGHVQRQPLPGDRRAKAVVLTAEGQAIGERVLRMTDTLSERLLEGISPQDIDVAERVLVALSDNLGRALAKETEVEPAS